MSRWTDSGNGDGSTPRGWLGTGASVNQRRVLSDRFVYFQRREGIAWELLGFRHMTDAEFAESRRGIA